jgi:hypothetical protein
MNDESEEREYNYADLTIDSPEAVGMNLLKEVFCRVI